MSDSPRVRPHADHGPILFALPLVFLLLLRFVLSFFPKLGWWGLDYVGYLPLWQLLTITSTSVVLALPGVAGNLSSACASIARVLFPANSGKALWRHGGFAVAVGLLVFSLSLPFPFLGGDGVHVMRRLFRFHAGVIGAYGQISTEPLTVLFYAGVTGFLSNAVREGSVNLTGYTMLFRIIGSLGATAMTFTVLRYAVKLVENEFDRVPLLTLLLFTGGSLFFFGYVEFYTPVFIMSAFFLLSGMYALRTQNRPFLPTVFLALAIAFHLSAVVFLPALLLLWSGPALTGQALDMRSPSVRLQLLLLLMGIAAAVIVYAMGIPGPWIPISGNVTSDTLFSVVHLRDVANNMLLTAPVAVSTVLLLLLTRRHSLAPVPSNVLFAGTALLWCGVLLLSQPAFAQDWDIFAIFGLAASALAWLLYLQVSNPVLRGYLHVQLIVQPALFLLPWLLLHMNQEGAVERYADLARQYSGILPSSVVAGFHETLRTEAVSREAGDEEIHQIAAMNALTEDPYEYMKLLRAITTRNPGVRLALPDVRSMLQRITLLRDSVLDIPVGEDAEARGITLRILYQSLVIAMGAVLPSKDRIAWLEEGAEAAVVLGHSFSIQAQLGHLAFETGNYDGARDWYQQALIDSLSAPTDGGAALSLLYSNLGIAQFDAMAHDAAYASFLHATMYPAARASAWSNLGFACFRTARITQAVSSFDHTLRMDSSDVNALYCLGRIRLEHPESREAGKWLLARFLLLESGTKRSNEIRRWLALSGTGK
ncbi:tetratricopeptide repeat protein [bacterium]|nr:tetratricopeptide repeat protein [bacterium]